MMFRSTEGRTSASTFRDSVFSGLARDGGLYVPQKLPVLSPETVRWFAVDSLPQVGSKILSTFIDDISLNELSAILERAWMFPIPLIHLEGNLYLLELFHGPTLAFKDVGARFLAQVVSHYVQASNQEVTVVVATSGDTGSAVAHGFFNLPRVTVYVLYPSGKISPLQERQMATLGNNIHALEVSGTFDDCQALVKRALGDVETAGALNLTTANSINLGRLLPQVAYYAWGVAQWEQDFRHGAQPGAPVFIVPSGNFGNLVAGVYAREMGIPIDRFVAATNVNDVGGEYIRSGSFIPRSAVQTFSNAMDVGNPSNIARLRSLYGGDHERLRRTVETVCVSDEQTLNEIRLTFERTGRVVDPHTAVGLAAARALPGSTPCIITATAHPAKFPDVIDRALGVRIPFPEQLQEAFQRAKQSVPLAPEYNAFRQILWDGIRPL